ncbi:MAG: CoA transferase, partial [Gammaproteobacteria bacterium]|nr:CoA transferase [Gammaproteobacteria bacterium]
NKLSESGVPCGEINNIEQTFNDPQVQHLQMSQSVESERLGSLDLISQPVVLDRTPSAMRVAPPERGAQTHELLDALGYTSTEIERLRENKII